jgi:Predicted membrane protein (DUF2157)
MLNHILDDLKSAELIDLEDESRIKNAELKQPFSVHWELKTLLYLGVVLLNIGLGFLIYQNIDTIGHIVIIGLISLLSCGCFFYAARTALPFSWGENKSPTPYFDYAVLLGCLTFLIVEGYLQFQYNVFGTQYSLATFIPMLLFFPVAYYFDHKGVLSMAIVALGAWLGLKITPLELINQLGFLSNKSLVYTGILLGILLALIGFISELKDLKKHFSFTYFNFSIHLFFVSTLTALFYFNNNVLFIPLIILGLIFWIYYALKTTSFYFFLFSVIYGYIAFTYLIINALSHINTDITVYFLYLIFSCAGIIILLSNYKNLIKKSN